MHFSLLVWLALSGLLIAAYILYVKRRNRKLACLVGDGDCDRVVKSRYGYLAGGIPNEFLGVVYYLVVLLWAAHGWGGWMLTLAAGVAFGASLYLVSIQAFVLRGWCEFCLATAVINGLIFGLAAF